jgi:hypothetical protein
MQEVGVLDELRKVHKTKIPTIRHAATEAFRHCTFKHRPMGELTINSCVASTN